MLPDLAKIIAADQGAQAGVAQTEKEAHRLALEVAAAFGAEVILLYVVDSSVLEEFCRFSGGERPRLLQEMEDSGARLLASLAKEAKQRGLAALVDLKTGMPDEIILQEAARHRADLIVMGKIGRKGHRRSLLGSVTERVLEAAHLPVLVVSPGKGLTTSIML